MKFRRPQLMLALLGFLVLYGEFVYSQQTFRVFSDSNDGFLEARGDTSTDLPPVSPWPTVHPDTFGTFQGTVGEWFGSGPDGSSAYGLTTIVLPFQLPSFGDVADPFADVDFGAMLNPNTGDNNSTDIDLYALARVDSDPAIQPEDWYSGASFDPTATLVQESFFTPVSPQGWFGEPSMNTDATGDAILTDFLNSAYAGGDNADKFVFLRLSYGSDTFATGSDNYNITFREAGQQGEWPVLTYTINAIPGDVDGNGQIELSDFDPILNNWRETNDTFGTVLARTDGDLNLDGVVNVADFREWKDAALAGGIGGAAVAQALSALQSASVPEPSSFALVLALAGALTSLRRRRPHCN